MRFLNYIKSLLPIIVNKNKNYKIYMLAKLLIFNQI